MSLSKNVRCAALCLAGATVCLFLLGPGIVWTLRGATDFMDLYAGAKLVFSHDQYNVIRVLATELHWTGYESPTRLFMRLPVFGLLLKPLALLPYSWASAIWEILCLGAIVAFAVLWPGDRKRVAIVCCWSLPAWMTLAEGQDTAFLLLWLALAVMALRKQRPLLAGLVLSLCAAKYHLFLLLPLWIIGYRLWRVAAGLTIGGIAMLAGSFMAGGPDWPMRYYRLLSEPANNPYPELMPNIYGLFGGAPSRIACAIVLAALVYLAIRQFQQYGDSHHDSLIGLAPVLMGGVLLAPHDYMADCVLLIPAVLLLLARPRSVWIELPCLFLATPIAYAALMLNHSFILIAPLVAVLSMLAIPSRFYESTLPQSALCPAAVADSRA